MKRYKALSLGVVIAIYFAVAGFQVVAAESLPQRAETRVQENEVARQEQRDVASQKLQTAKQEACQNRQKNITAVMSRITTRKQNQINLFSTIAERVEAFYVKKGKTLQNYDDLVTAVAAKKSQAAETVAAIAASAQSFTCDSNNPRTLVQNFRDNLQKANQALKDYKTAVRDLIVGVKSVQDQLSSQTNNGDGQ